MIKDKIEIEDLWKIAPNKIKLFLIISFISFLCLYPFIQTTENYDKSKIDVIVANKNNLKNIQLKSLNEINFETHIPVISKHIFQKHERFCFSKKITETTGEISCSSLYGIVNNISTYTVQNNDVLKASYKAKPVIPAQIAIAITLWLLMAVFPAYFWTKKNTDLSLLKKRIGKRKLFNFN